MRITLLLAIALPTLAACASTPAPIPDTPVRVVGCNMNPDLPGAYRAQGVMLEFTVNEKGVPFAQAARVAPRYSATDSELAEARQILGTCTFEPALHENHPVHSQVSMFIRLDSEAMD